MGGVTSPALALGAPWRRREGRREWGGGGEDKKEEGAGGKKAGWAAAEPVTPQAGEDTSAQEETPPSPRGSGTRMPARAPLRCRTSRLAISTVGGTGQSTDTCSHV